MYFSTGIYLCPMDPVHLVGLYTTRLPVFRLKGKKAKKERMYTKCYIMKTCFPPKGLLTIFTTQWYSITGKSPDFIKALSDFERRMLHIGSG